MTTDHVMTVQGIIDTLFENRGKIIYGLGIFANAILTYRRLPTEDSSLGYVIFYCLMMLSTGNLTRAIAGAQSKSGNPPPPVVPTPKKDG